MESVSNMSHVKTFVMVMAFVAFLVIGMIVSSIFNQAQTFRITGKLEEVKSFAVGDDFKYLLKVRVANSDDKRFPAESITVVNAHDSRIIGLIDYSQKTCIVEGVAVCTYTVTHDENITLLVTEIVGSNGLTELEGSIQ